RLTKPVVDRLLLLRAAYPNTPLASLPSPVRAEVKQILTSATSHGTPLGTSQSPAVQETRLYPALPHGATHNGQRNGTRPQPLSPDENARTVLGTDIRTGAAVTISLTQRFQGVFGIGATGTGKTTLDLNMIMADIRQGRGICLVEPHGDLTRNIIAAMP